MATTPNRSLLAGGTLLVAVVAGAVVVRRRRGSDLVEESEDYEAENTAMFLDEDVDDGVDDADDLDGTAANPEELAVRDGATP
jgi:hypothetical protein